MYWWATIGISLVFLTVNLPLTARPVPSIIRCISKFNCIDSTNSFIFFYNHYRTLVCSISVYILNMGLVENTPTGKLVFNVMSAFAEFERVMIVERTQEDKAIAKQREDLERAVLMFIAWNK